MSSATTWPEGYGYYDDERRPNCFQAKNGELAYKYDASTLLRLIINDLLVCITPRFS
jgi:hypothetical protein